MKNVLLMFLFISSVLLPVLAVMTAVKRFGAGTKHALYGIAAYVFAGPVISDPLLRLIQNTFPYYIFSTSHPALAAVSEAVLRSVFLTVMIHAAFVRSGREEINGWSAITLSAGAAAAGTIFIFGIPSVYAAFADLTYLDSFNEICCSSISAVLFFINLTSAGIIISETAAKRTPSFIFTSFGMTIFAYLALGMTSCRSTCAALFVLTAAESFIAYRITKERIIKK